LWTLEYVLPRVRGDCHTGQNGSGQTGTGKMVYGKIVAYTEKMVLTKWYGQNGTDKMVAIFRIDYNSSALNAYLVTKSDK